MEIKLYADKVYAVEYAEMNGQRWSGGDGVTRKDGGEKWYEEVGME